MKFMQRFKARGGVHPDGHKELSAEHPIRVLPLPERLFVPLQQHIGAPARPVVAVDDKVLKGQLIAAGHGNVSAPVHAPTSGRIAAIGDYASPHPSGLPAATVIIEADGEDRWFEGEAAADPFSLSRPLRPLPIPCL